jgi:hypothetical protein
MGSNHVDEEDTIGHVVDEVTKGCQERVLDEASSLHDCFIQARVHVSGLVVRVKSLTSSIMWMKAMILVVKAPCFPLT